MHFNVHTINGEILLFESYNINKDILHERQLVLASLQASS